MKQAHRDAWCARLRDPSSKQAHSVLHEWGWPDEDYSEEPEIVASCCLGHFQIVMENQFGIPVAQKDDLLDTYDAERVGLDHNLQEILSCLNDGAEVPLGADGRMTTSEQPASILNDEDTHKWTLPEIADWVEANIPVTD